MTVNPPKPSRWTLPNLLTGFRFVAAPVLMWLAWHDNASGFMALLALVFLSDLLDGMAARWTGQVSAFGAALDSSADIVTYSTIAVCCWWLWPDVVRQESVYVGAIVVGMLVSTGAAYAKFGCFTSYHTWAVKLAAACIGTSLYILFFEGPAWPFRIASVIGLLAGLEETVITLVLSKPESDVRSIWFIVKNGKRKPN
ncbi:MAG: CDP-alcohol phosphatidyltransferase family protein [Methylomonas sp.]|nr:CDP-alcohol phosphatidyltransferase family protein [Methylomonas sp.]